MARLEDGLHYGYEVSLFDGQYWRDLYGMPGRYHKRFVDAQDEVIYAMQRSPVKYQSWTIERLVIDADGFPRDRHPMRCMLAQSR